MISDDEADNIGTDKNMWISQEENRTRYTQRKNHPFESFRAAICTLTYRKKVLYQHPPLYTHRYYSCPLLIYANDLVVCGLAVRVHILDRLHNRAVSVTQAKSGDGAIALVSRGTLAGAGVVAAIVVGSPGSVVAGLSIAGIGRNGINRARSVGEELAGWQLLSRLGQNLVWRRQIRQRVVRAGGDDLVALDGDVEVGDGGWVDLAVGANDLVVHVLGEVRLDVLGLERREVAGRLLTLQAGGQGKGATGDDDLRGIATHAAHVAENTISTDVVGVLGVVLRRVVVLKRSLVLLGGRSGD